jgi:hypothetical protein
MLSIRDCSIFYILMLGLISVGRQSTTRRKRGGRRRKK